VAGYCDPDFAGNGRILCLLCDRPVVEHRIGPCPTAGVAQFAGTTSSPGAAAARKRRQRRIASEGSGG
jgi:hypothetical protein